MRVNHDLVFLVTSPHPEAIQESIKSHLIRTKDTLITQEIPRDLVTLSQEMGAETYIYIILQPQNVKSLALIARKARVSIIMFGLETDHGSSPKTRHIADLNKIRSQWARKKEGMDI